MAGTTTLGIKPRRVSGQTSIPLWAGPEGASVTAPKGAVLIATAGFLVPAATQAVAGIFGISTTTGHNDGTAATHQMEYVPALPSMRFEATLVVDSTNTHILVATNLGIAYGLCIDVTNVRWFIDPSDTSHDAVNVIQFVDAIGTVKPRVEFVFMSSVTVFGAAAG
jgi:hypothetical protein